MMDLTADRRSVQLIQLAPRTIDALAVADLAAANRSAPVALTSYLISPECLGTWARRSRQLMEDPPAADWITRVVFDPVRQLTVGRAGFHGPPDAAGLVEVGYAIDPAYRRQGYARAALQALLDRAGREPAVRIVRATVRPDNIASRQLILQYGFIEVGEQWDDEDGLETIFEVAAAGLSRR